MGSEGFSGHLVLGAAAGFAGTLALQAIRTANQKWIPQGSPPMTQDPARFMVEKAREALRQGARDRVPQKVENAAVKLPPMVPNQNWLRHLT